MTQPRTQNDKIAAIVASDRAEAEKIDAIAHIRGWFRPELDSIYYPTVLDYVEGDIDVATASTTLFDPIDEKISAEKLDDVDFLDLWYSIIHAAKRTSYHEAEEAGQRNAPLHAKLADLVAAFRDHKVKNNEQYNYLYESLTDFSMACREVYNDAPEPDASEYEIDAWANVNFFYACVTAKKVSDLSLFAIWSMRSALEEELEDDDQGTAVQKYNVYVPAAASWIFGMGKALYTKEENLEPSDPNQGNPARGGPLWKGQAEFSKERWNLWKERMAVVGEMGEVSEKTRNIARDAVETMERAERFSSVLR